MADFCKQCSKEIFGQDFKDLSSAGGEQKLTEPGTGWQVLCEGCGPTLVDDAGVCVSADCLKHHGLLREKKAE